MKRHNRLRAFTSASSEIGRRTSHTFASHYTMHTARARAALRPLATASRTVLHVHAVSQLNWLLSTTISYPELVCQPACTPPAGLPSLSRVRHRTGMWQCGCSLRLRVVALTVAPRRSETPSCPQY
jgi:hypothetical protein